MTDFVMYDQQDGIATLTMDDGKANAYGPSMISALSEALQKAKSDAKIVLVKGRPGIFCAGFDLKIMTQGDEARLDMVNRGASLLLDLYLHPQPIVMACTGHALAAGAVLLLAADYRVGLKGDFKLGLNETTIGMTMPTFGIEMARDRLGSENLTQAVLNARLYNPEEAVAVHYLDEAVHQDQYNSVIETKLEAMLSIATPAFAATKIGIRGSVAKTIRESLA
jgi:enoyl-CoA hydratase